MKSNRSDGFTIIETMLFLGITGLLILGILMGTGNSINNQRYRDSVVSLQSVLQQQYSEVLNVSSANDGSQPCDILGTGDIKPAGQSDCVIIGRYINTTDDNGTLVIRDVISDDTAPGSSGTNEISRIKNDYNVRISRVGSEEYRTEWNTKWYMADSGGSAFSVLIIRSPISGVVRTFIDPTRSVEDSKIDELVDAAFLSNSLTICMDSSGLMGANDSGIVWQANAVSASGIEALGEAQLEDLGVKCDK